MLNHFRTLLLNLSASPENIQEHVAANFNSLPLKADLTRIYNALFPISKVAAKYFYAHNYLTLLKGLAISTTDFDSRISYDLSAEDYFNVVRISAPVASHPQFQILVSGNLAVNKQQDYYSDSFLVKNEADSGTHFTVYSETTQLYHTQEPTTSPTPVIHTYVESPETSSISEPIVISTTGLSFRFVLAPGFDVALNKTWRFTASAPREFNFFEVYSRIKALNPFKILKRYNVDIKEEEQQWNEHFNILYKFGAFLSAYVKVLNSML